MKNKKPQKWVGDFLLLLNAQIDNLPVRDNSTWDLEYEAHNCCLYLSSPSTNWRGSPVNHWHKGTYLYWLFGSLWGTQQNINPADWAGHFILLGFDQVHKTWHVWTNRSATFHAYYAKTIKGTALSSYSPAAACVTDHQLNMEALISYFSFGFFPQAHTYFKGLNIIQPYTELVINQDGKEIAEKRLWSWQHRPDPSLDFDQAVDSFAELFHKVIQEQVSGRRVALPISGGLDSRSTVSALKDFDDHSNLWPYSYGYTDESIETKIAKQIADAYQLPLSRFTIQPYLFDKFPNVIDCIEGFQDLTQTRQAYITNDLAEHSDYVMAAHMGDLWLGDIGYPKTLHLSNIDKVEDFAYNKYMRKGGKWLTNFIFQNTDIKIDHEVYLREYLRSELSKLSEIKDPDFKLKALKTNTYVFRWSLASLRMYQPGAFPLLPFFDPRIYDFFCKLPTSYVAGRRLQIEYLKRYAPDLAQVPWQPYDANLYTYQHFDSWQLPKRAVKKLGRILSGKQVIERNWEVQLLNQRGRAGLQDWLLTPGLKIHQFVAKEKLEPLLSDFYDAPDAGKGYAVSMLLTFSAWLEHYA